MHHTIKCKRCKHEWETRATSVYVTCPSCLIKTPNTVWKKPNPNSPKFKQKENPNYRDPYAVFERQLGKKPKK